MRHFVHNLVDTAITISPNEVFGDIMVLAPSRPPVDPDDVSTLTRTRIRTLTLIKII